MRLDTRSEHAGELQILVDTLSLAVGLPVLLDDAALIPIAFSRQWGNVDRVRADCILGRGADVRVRDVLLAQGIASADRPLWTAPDAGLQMQPRLCFPVRRDGVLHGFFWVIDPEQTLGEKELARIKHAARAVGDLLVVRPDPELREETALLAGVCSAVEREREEALVSVVARGSLSDRPLVALRVQPLGGHKARLGDMAQRIKHRVSSGHALAGRLAGGLLLVLNVEDSVLRMLDPAMLAGWALSAADAPVAVGQSDVVPGLRALPEARRQAELAARAAVRARPPSAAWATLGATRLIAQLSPAVAADIPTELRRLLTGDPVLATTLAAFLEHAGDIKRTATSLSLHRSGLYYRLQRIEELTGLDLSSGEDRLLAHLAVRLSDDCREA